MPGTLFKAVGGGGRVVECVRKSLTLMVNYTCLCGRWTPGRPFLLIFLCPCLVSMSIEWCMVVVA